MRHHPIPHITLLGAWIFDLDQTLALIGDRDPYDAATCDRDTLNGPVADILRSLQQAHPDYLTLLLTSRPYRHKQPTDTFLRAHDLHYDRIFMREDDDWTPCAFYKWRIYHQHIRDHFAVQAVFDDNPVVARMFHELGLPVFQVGGSDANF